MNLLVFLLIMSQSFAVIFPLKSNSPDDEPVIANRESLVPPPTFLSIEEMNKTIFSDLKIDKEELKKVKFYLINGEVKIAQAIIYKMAYSQTKLRPVIFRYLALLSFIQRDFAKVDEYLSLPELQQMPHYSKICTLKVLTQIVLSKTFDLEQNWARCQTENSKDFRAQNIIWLETLVQLKINPQIGSTQIPFKQYRLAALDLSELKVVMKLALYLNQEHLLINQIQELKVDQLQDPEVRELAGQAYFRMGAFAKSYKYIEDLKSPNAENIKGNLYILRQKYELAYAQFKLALEQKQNSQNALERILPLAWLLGDWEKGSQFAELVMVSPQMQMNKLTLLATFLMQKGDYAKAEKTLDILTLRSQKGSLLEVTQVASFTALMQNKTDLAFKNARLSCAQYDMVNCWVMYQLRQWDTFALTIRREDPIQERKEWEKLTQEVTHSPLEEPNYINQLDIEEMDDELIQLISKK